MAKRKVDPAALSPVDVPTGAASLAAKLDKGFPYDDGDSTITDRAPLT